ncbi:MAG: MlaD family protein [Syntrophothermus sp.]|nr:MlaD family protein [Ignavibacteriaceae bacterium]
MEKKFSGVKLGIFIFLGAAIFTVAIFLIGDKDAMFSSTFKVKALFKDIQGLKAGATVRMNGIDVGTVSNIEMVNDTSGRIEVTLNLKEEVRKFVKVDSKATIETEGLVGSKVLIILMGSADAAQVKDNGYIQTVTPMGFSQILNETQGILNYTKEMTKNLSEITDRVNKGEGTLGLLLNDEKLYNYATSLTQTADSSLQNVAVEIDKVTKLFDDLGQGVNQVVTNIDNVVMRIDTVLIEMKGGKGVLGALLVNGSRFDTLLSNTMGNIEKTSYDARIAASKLSENMEALKHNWLFKSYFEKRGYWNTAEYEDVLDQRIKEINLKMKELDDKINELKSLENKKGN